MHRKHLPHILANKKTMQYDKQIDNATSTTKISRKTMHLVEECIFKDKFQQKQILNKAISSYPGTV